jgi:hypothetical protein
MLHRIYYAKWYGATECWSEFGSHRLTFSEVVSGILPHLMHIRHERWQPTLQRIGLNPPERLS